MYVRVYVPVGRCVCVVLIKQWKYFYRAKSCPTGLFKARTHAHALLQAPASTSILQTISNRSLAYRQRLSTEGHSGVKGKISGSIFLEQEMFLRWIWRCPERVSFGEEVKGHSMYRDWRQKRLGNQQWKVWHEGSGCCGYQKQSREYGLVCKIGDSHRDEMEQCTWYICTRECLSCTEFFVRLKASGELETEMWCG